MNIPISLEFNLILEKVAQYALSTSGREVILKTTPTDDFDKACLLMEQTTQALNILIRHMHYPVRSFSAIEGELKRLNANASLSCGEILRVISVFKSAKHSAILAKESTENIIATLAQGLFYDERAIKHVDECIISEEDVADSASRELTHIRNSIRKENNFIKEKLQGMLKHQDDQKYLQEQIITQRNGRYVVPVKAEYKGQVAGIVHEKSASGATLFIEPVSVVEANNRIRELEGEEQREIARILGEISNMLSAYTTELEINTQILTDLDVFFSKASYAKEVKGVPVRHSKENIIDITEGRHPLIDPQKVVPISLCVSNDVKSLIITGPNTGGKTVTLKLVGLFCAMAQSGIFVSAKSPVYLSVFDGIFADIGDEQSIEQSLSTFSAHMKSIIHTLDNAKSRSLVLLDELGAGTDPNEGSAIAQAVLKYLSNNGATIIATTHISDLKEFATKNEGFENASMEFDPQTLTPTYRLLMGTAGRSNAILISKGLGLKEEVINLALGYMDEEHLKYSQLIENAQLNRQKAYEDLEKARQAKAEAEAEVANAQMLIQKAKEKKKQILEKANKKAIEIIDDAKNTAEDAIKLSKKLKNKDESARTKLTKKVRDDLSDKKQFIEKHHNKAKYNEEGIDAQEIKEGDTVIIIKMDAPATVLKAPNEKGMVELQAGILKTQMHHSELAKAPTSKKEKRAVSSVNLNYGRHVSMEIDLHGMNVEEAIIEVDKYLDDAFLSGLQEVRIIHGRGTGVLRSGIQKYMRNHPHVLKFRQGRFDEGDIGVTIVTLK